jgi:hypothetical protein
MLGIHSWHWDLFIALTCWVVFSFDVVGMSRLQQSHSRRDLLLYSKQFDSLSTTSSMV